MYLEDVTSNVNTTTPVDQVLWISAKHLPLFHKKKSIKKLNHMKINGFIVAWLSERKERVVSRGTSFEWLPVTNSF